MRAVAVGLLMLGGCGADAAPGPGGAGERAAAVAGSHFTVRGRWPDPGRITYRIEDRDAALSVEPWRLTVTRACDAWSATGLVALVPAADGEPADVTLGWRRGRHGACEAFGSNSTIAHSGPVGPGTFVHFDADRRWVVDAPDDRDGYSLYGTALHELGHVLGLGHSAAGDAVMRPGVIRSAPLSWSERFALRSLYGGGGEGAEAGDLQVAGADGSPRAALCGVAPPGVSSAAVFDADGDGRDDVLVWRTDRAGNGVLMVYHFTAGPALARTTGPYYGVAGAGAENGPARLPDGQRLFVTRFPNGHVVARRFDEHALLHPYPGLTADALEGGWPPSPPPWSGDLDGDGRAESVQPAAGR